MVSEIIGIKLIYPVAAMTVVGVAVGISLFSSVLHRKVVDRRKMDDVREKIEKHQKEYLEAIDNFDIVFSIGPAGTGKTYLAVARAVAELRSKRRKRLILVRPAVEAGETLGFLPGDIKAKVDPYLRPVYDALHELMPAEKIAKMIELGIIEISPLAFMRGRTLNNSFVILDEAQNTTVAQMKMFLTRLGEGSRAIITGDITQIDLDKKIPSGLVKIQHILKGVKGVKFIYLSDKDVVRHRLVQDIIRAYDRYEKRIKGKGKGK